MDFVVRPRLGCFEPNADVVVDEERGRVVVALEIAGADLDSLTISVEDRHFAIGGRRAEAIRLRHGSFIQKEISYGEFAKRIALPVAVEYDGVVANYADGVLIIALTISPTAYRPTMRTEIRLTIKRTL